MTEVDAVVVRMELAQGHWVLEEHGSALDCLERAAFEAPDRTVLRDLVASLLDEPAAAAAGPEIVARLRNVLKVLEPPAESAEAIELPRPMATATVAGLLAEQGHAEQARVVSEDVLRRNPDDERALAVRASLEPEGATRRGRIIAELERWRSNASQRRLERRT